MGDVVYNRWEIVTTFDNTFYVNGNRFDVKGTAHVDAEHDDVDSFTDVKILDPDMHPDITLSLSLNDKHLERDSEVFDVVHDIVTEVLEANISPTNTDLRDEDFDDITISDLIDVVVSV
jgi:hypothetical protein